MKDERKLLPKMRKWTTPTTKTAKVSYYNSSLKLSIETKYATEFSPVNSYKECLVFFVKKTLKI